MLEIQRIDSQTKESLASAKFKVTRTEDNTVSEYLTDADGKIVIKNLTEGIYTVEKITAPTGYILNVQHKEIELEAGKTKTLIYENTKKPTLILTKTNVLTEKPVPNTVFKIPRETEKGGITTLGIYKTDKNGQIILKNVEPGWYSAVETKAPNGYLLNDVAQDFEIKHTKTVTLEFTNELLTALVIKKIDAKTGGPLSGAKFRIEEQDGTYVGEYTSDSDGTIHIPQLSPGWFVIRETKAPAGYQLDETPKTVEVKTQTPTVVTFENELLTSIVIKKIDAKTGEPLSGAKFEIERQNGEHVGEYTSGSDGTVNVSQLAPDWYIIKEIKAPEGYLLDETPKTVEVKTQTPTVVTFENQLLAALQIKKVDVVTGAPLVGAKFKVMKQNGEVIGEYTTEKDGFVNVPELAPGYYSVSEMKAPEGYILDESPKTVEVKTNKPTSVVFENKPLAGIKIIKTDSESGEPLEGVVFPISKLNGEKIGTFKTDKEGMIYVSNLEDGYYSITETEGLEGYHWDQSPATVEMKSGKLTIHEVKNEPYSLLVIKKTSSRNGEPIEGVEFLVTKENGEEIGYYETDSSGRIEVEGLEDGVYLVKEIKAVKGFQLDSKAREVEIRDGKRAVVKIENDPLSSVLIRKIDSVTGKGIEGVTSLLYDGDNEPIGQFVSDNRAMCGSERNCRKESINCGNWNQQRDTFRTMK